MHAQVNRSASDIALLEGLARNEKDAIEKIYRDHYQMILHMIMINNGNPDDAADVFQEGMIVLFEKSKSKDFELNCQLKTYLYSVCRRLWLKKLNQQQRFGRQTDDVEQIVPVEEDMEVHEKRQQEFNIMENALQKIGEPCKSLLEAYYLQKKHMQQIAEEFSYTNADNAKTQKYKCLVRLKKLFFAQYKNTP
jgi:RNA polymerase sigma factor (sigma-70 family)